MGLLQELVADERFKALPAAKKRIAIHRFLTDQLPEYASFTPDEQEQVVSKAVEKYGLDDGLDLGGALHSGLAGLAGGFRSLADTVRGFHEAPVRLARAAGAEGLADALEYNPILQGTKAASDWLGEQEAEQAAQGGEGFLSSAANVIGQTPGVAAKFGLELAGGPGKLKALGATLKGLGQVGGLEFVSRLGRGEELPEAATGAATEAGMVGAFGGIGKLASGIAKPGLRALAHMGGTAALGGALEVPAVLSGERTPQEAAGSALGLAALAGFGEIKSARKLSALRDSLQKPVSQGGHGLDQPTAYRVAELLRTGRTDEANAEIAAWREAHKPEAPPPEPPPPDTRTPDQVIEEERARLGIDRRPSLTEAMQNLQTARQELDMGPSVPAANAALMRLRLARDAAGGPVQFPGPKPTEEAAVRLGIGDEFRRLNPLSEEHPLPEDQTRAARLELGLGTEANAREIEQARQEVVALANELGVPSERIAALPMGQLYQALERLRAAKDALGREVPARQPAAQTMQQGYEALFNQSMERARRYGKAVQPSEPLPPPPAPPPPAPPAVPPAAPVVAKQPWEMTREEFLAKAAQDTGLPLDGPSRQEGLHRDNGEVWSDGHRTLIRKALAAGKPVPPEVLAEYPDLIPKGAPNAQEARTPTQAASSQEGPQGGASGQVRLRNAPQKRVEAVQGEEGEVTTPPPAPPPPAPPAVAPAAPVAAKQPWEIEPWEVTRENYLSQVGGRRLLDAVAELDARGAQTQQLDRFTSDPYSRLLSTGSKDPLRKGETWRKRVLAYGEADLSRYTKKHRQAVERALAAGKPVPPEVLAEYPDLAPPRTAPLGSPPVQPVQRQMGTAPGEAVGPRTIQTFIEERLGMPASVGGFKNPKKGLAGIWKSQPQIMRTARWGDIDTMAHEVAHGIVTKHLNNQFRSPSTAVQSELEALGVALYGKKAPTAGYEQEGFSELVRYWLTDPAQAKAKAPLATRWLETKLLGAGGKAEAIGPQMRELQGLYRRYMEEGPMVRSAQSVAWEPTKKAPTISGREAFEDSLIRILGAEEELGWTGQLDRDRAYRVLRATQGTAPGVVKEAAIGEGIPDPLSPDKTLAPSLQSIFQPHIDRGGVEGAKDVTLYAVARRTVELAKQGKTALPMELPDAEARVRAGDQQPGYLETARKLNAWANATVDWLVRSGGMTEAEGKAIKESGEFYVPLSREFLSFEGGPGGGGTGPGVVGGSSGFRRMSETGSSRVVKNPIDMLLANFQTTVEAGHKAMANRALVKMAREAEGAGRIIDIIDAPPPGTGSNRNFLSAVVDGKRVWMEVRDRPLYEALTGLNAVHVPVFADLVLGGPTRIIKLGATGLNPAFSLVTNLIRDTWEATTQTGFQEAWKVPYRALRQIGPAFKSQFTGKPTAASRGWVRGGGQMTTFYGVDTGATRQLRKEVLAGGGTKGRLRFMTMHPVTALREVLAFSEGINRSNEWNAAYDKTYAERIKAGDTPEQAHVESALRASTAAKEVTIDFTRAGTYGRAINQVAAFFNPSVQGLSKLGREMRNRPATILARGVAGITIPAITLWLLHKDEPWYDNLPIWEKSMFMHFKLGDKVVRLPLPQNWALMFYTSPIATLEAYRKKNPKEFAKLTVEQALNMLPDPLPSTLKPAQEALAPVPFSWFKRRQLVPKRLEGLSPELQYTQYTPAFYRATANVFSTIYRKITGSNPTTGISPIVLQHLTEGYTGGLTRNVQGLVAEKKEAADIPVVGRLFTRMGGGGRVMDELYAQIEEASTAYKSLTSLQKAGKTEEARRYAKEFAHLLGPNGSRYQLLQKAARDLTALRKQDATGERLRKIASAYLRAANRGLKQWTPVED